MVFPAGAGERKDYPVSGDTVLCTSCGKEIPAASELCPACGAANLAQSPESEGEEAPDAEDSAQGATAASTQTEPSEPGSIEAYLLELFGSSEPAKAAPATQEPAPKQEAGQATLSFEELLGAEPTAEIDALPEIDTLPAEVIEKPTPIVETAPEDEPHADELSEELSVAAPLAEVASVEAALPADFDPIEIPALETAQPPPPIEVPSIEIAPIEIPVAQGVHAETPVTETPVAQEPPDDAPVVNVTIEEPRIDEAAISTQPMPSHVVSPVRGWKPILIEGLVQDTGKLTYEHTQAEEVVVGSSQGADASTHAVEPEADLSLLLSQIEITQPAVPPDEVGDIEPMVPVTLQEDANSETSEETALSTTGPDTGPLLASQQGDSESELLGDTGPFYTVDATQVEQQPAALETGEELLPTQSDDAPAEYRPLLASQADWGATPANEEPSIDSEYAGWEETTQYPRPEDLEPWYEAQDQTPHPQAQAPWSYNDPNRSRPRPGTPEYEEMVRQALEEQRQMPRNIQSKPQQPASFVQSQPEAPPVQPSAYSDPTRPHPRPGTPEYEEMVKEAINQRLRNTHPLGDLPAQPTVPLPQEPTLPDPPIRPAEPAPRPKPGTPEYEAMVKQAMEEMKRKQREGKS